MKNARQICFDALLAVQRNKAYSNITLDEAFKAQKIEPRDKTFATMLFYGVLERKLTLERIILNYLNKPISKLDTEVRIILQMGIYQLLYMESVPDTAAVDETVSLAPYARKASAKGFVNAILRGFLRDGKETRIDENDVVNFYSCPKPLYEMWVEQYDRDTAKALASASIGRPPLAVRVNRLKTEPQKLIGFLENRGVHAYADEEIEDCLYLENSGQISSNPQFKQGLFHVQDAASQLCVEALAPKSGETVLDICSAPGSKSFTAAELMGNEGKIYAFDIHENKLDMIKKGAKRLGITIISEAAQDGCEFNPNIPSADCILCDVPCSGLGIIRRKPEIKYKDFKDFEKLPETQFSILNNAARYLKKGGRMIYSTCTTNRKENEEVIKRFLAENKEFIPLQFPQNIAKIDNNRNMITLLPNIDGCDGFFFALLQRV